MPWPGASITGPGCDTSTCRALSTGSALRMRSALQTSCLLLPHPPKASLSRSLFPAPRATVIRLLHASIGPFVRKSPTERWKTKRQFSGKVAFLVLQPEHFKPAAVPGASSCLLYLELFKLPGVCGWGSSLLRGVESNGEGARPSAAQGLQPGTAVLQTHTLTSPAQFHQQKGSFQLPGV